MLSRKFIKTMLSREVHAIYSPYLFNILYHLTMTPTIPARTTQLREAFRFPFFRRRTAVSGSPSDFRRRTAVSGYPSDFWRRTAVSDFTTDFWRRTDVSGSTNAFWRRTDASGSTNRKLSTPRKRSRLQNYDYSR